MTIKQLPSIKAFNAPKGGQYDAPSSAYENWAAVRAATDNQNNNINVYDVIGDSWDGAGMTTRIVSSILRKAEGKTVTVNINSPGGDYFEGVAIYNLLREYDGQVNVKILGLAASAASVVAMAADELRIAKTAQLMIHNSWGIVVGNQNDLREAADTFALFDNSMAVVYQDRTNIALDVIYDMMAADTWISGEDAVEMGFADAFLQSDEVTEDDDRRVSAKFKIDKALARQGIPRSKRREMYKELSAMRNAGKTTLEASEIESVQTALNELQNLIKGN